MAQYSDTLHSMAWQVEQLKPNSTPQLRHAWLNAAIREALDERPYWAGTLKRTTLRIPAAYTTGSVAVETGSDVLIGTGTAWPVSDVANTTLSTAVRNVGWNLVTPAAMTGITPDTLLYVGGANPEVVAVVKTNATKFQAKFQYPHDAGVPLTSSSFVGRQVKFGGSHPIYTIRAVTAAGVALLDNLWAGESASGLSYQILQMYVTIAHDIKTPLVVLDPVQPLELALNVPKGYLDATDPQRTGSGPPQLLSDAWPNACGNMLYEVYPPQTGERHLHALYAQQWPDLASPDDQPPYFINPQIFIDGACSRALRSRLDPNDRYLDVNSANFYEAKFQQGKVAAASADNSKAQQAYSWLYSQMRYGLDKQSHDFSIYED